MDQRSCPLFQRAASSRLGKGKKRTIIGKPEFFRGDAWQMLLADAACAFRAALYIRADLLAGFGVDSRIAVGLGAVKNLAENNISRSVGEAFRSSGHALDKMPAAARLAIVVPDRASELDGWIKVVAKLSDALIRQWTRRQAEIAAVALLSEGLSHEQLAERLKPAVTRLGVSKSLSGAAWNGLNAALDQFEGLDWGSGMD